MKSLIQGRSAPAIVVALCALLAVGAGLAAASPGRESKALSKSKVKKIATSVADNEIAVKAPTLSVDKANSANTAGTAPAAGTAASSQPTLFAQVSAAGGVNASNSKGIGSANVGIGGSGVYCIHGLPAFRGGQVTIDSNEAADIAETAQFGLGDGGGPCSTDTQAVVTTFADGNPGNHAPKGFFLVLYN